MPICISTYYSSSKRDMNRSKMTVRTKGEKGNERIKRLPKQPIEYRPPHVH